MGKKVNIRIILATSNPPGMDHRGQMLEFLFEGVEPWHATHSLAPSIRAEINLLEGSIYRRLETGSQFVNHLTSLQKWLGKCFVRFWAQ